ncbi:MAG: T9SS type A sorting domain-containing protein [Thermoflexibacter sp.]|jgi:hypothetical protein|nr:T9SS type A sorting domain-containing protein [Thermoflexibacter sp.]
MTKYILSFILFICTISTSLALGGGEKDKNAPVSVSDVFSEDKLYATDQIEISNIYPNPAHDLVKFNYVINDPNMKVKITIRNVLGSVVQEEELSHQSRQLEISVNEYTAGMYFYTLSINNQSIITKKFLVKR